MISRRTSDVLDRLLSGDTCVATRSQLTTQIGASTLSEAVSSGLLARVAPGVYALSSRAGDILTRVHATRAWAGDNATISGLASLAVRGHRVPTAARVLVIADHEFKRRPIPGIRLLRTRARCEFLSTPLGRLARTEDSLVHAWIETSRERRRGLMLDLLREIPHDNAHLLRRALAWPRVPQRAELARLVGVHKNGVTSYLEHCAHHEVFVGAEWQRFERQATVRAGRRSLTVDMLARDVRLAIELDGTRFHSGDRQRRRDLERDALLASQGYTTIRLTYEDITQRPEWCRATVRAAVLARLNAQDGRH